MNIVRVLIILSSLFLGACLQFDSSEKSLPNNYEITWVDDPINRNISSEKGGKILPAHIFEVGYNDSYIIAKQHPQNGSFAKRVTNKEVINWFVLRMEKKGVLEKKYGPLTEREFVLKCKELEVSDIEFSIKYKVDENIRID
jgi:hypothetical protein